MIRILISFFVLSILVSCQPQNSYVNSTQADNGIVGGKRLKNGELPSSHIVAIYDIDEQFLCTGTIISENAVLTAAHCVTSKISKLKVIFGVDAFETLNAREMDIQKEYIRRVTYAKVHEGYVFDSERQSQIDQNDIAIVKFAGPLPEGYKPASLMTSDEDLAVGVEATVAGYGVTEVTATEIDPKKFNKKKLSEGLETGAIVCDEPMHQCFEVEMAGDGELQSAVAKIKGFTVSEVRLDESNGQGTCSGDSGGPAFIKKGSDYFLFGVTSRGNLLCDYEGVYTSVIAHGQWIQKNLAN